MPEKLPEGRQWTGIGAKGNAEHEETAENHLEGLTPEELKKHLEAEAKKTGQRAEPQPQKDGEK